MIYRWIVLLIVLAIFNMFLLYYRDWSSVESLLKINLLFVGLLSGKLLFDVMWYYNLKKKDSYNNFYKDINYYVEQIETELKKVEFDELMLEDIQLYDDKYTQAIYKIYHLNKIVFLLKLIEVNLDLIMMVDKKLKDGYKKYIYSMIRMQLKQK